MTGTLLNGRTPVPNRVATVTVTTGKTTVRVRVRTNSHGQVVLTQHPAHAETFTATAVFGPSNAPTISRSHAVRITTI